MVSFPSISRRPALATLGIALGACLAVVLVLAATVEGNRAGQAQSASTGAIRGGPVAVDVAVEAGLGIDAVNTWSAAAADYDRDGAQDVLIGLHGSGSQLWRNDGTGHYRRVADGAWPPHTADRHGCAWADVDRNGRQDVYCATGRGRRNALKRAWNDGELWLQSRRGRFREVGTEWKVGDPCGRGRFVAFLHANRDRYPDLFVGNAGQRDDRSDPCDAGRGVLNEASKLFINQGGRGFRYAPGHVQSNSTPGARCAVVLDFNGDGRDDLLACVNGGRPRLFANTLRRGLVDVRDDHRLDWTVTDADVADLDRDGDPDIVTSSADVFAFHLNRRGRFGPRQVIDRVGDGSGRSVAAGDVDGDRDPDVYGMVGGGSGGNADDWIWLNHRLDFSEVRAPSSTGDAEDVVPLRPRQGRRAAFLVLNGRNREAGPVQLIRVVSAAP